MKVVLKIEEQCEEISAERDGEKHEEKIREKQEKRRRKENSKNNRKKMIRKSGPRQDVPNPARISPRWSQKRPPGLIHRWVKGHALPKPPSSPGHMDVPLLLRCTEGAGHLGLL